jgi:hypothetical protein
VSVSGVSMVMRKQFKLMSPEAQAQPRKPRASEAAFAEQHEDRTREQTYLRDVLLPLYNRIHGCK